MDYFTNNQPTNIMIVQQHPITNKYITYYNNLSYAAFSQLKQRTKHRNLNTVRRKLQSCRLSSQEPKEGD